MWGLSLDDHFQKFSSSGCMADNATFSTTKEYCLGDISLQNKTFLLFYKLIIITTDRKRKYWISVTEFFSLSFTPCMRTIRVINFSNQTPLKNFEIICYNVKFCVKRKAKCQNRRGYRWKERKQKILIRDVGSITFSLRYVKHFFSKH